MKKEQQPSNINATAAKSSEKKSRSNKNAVICVPDEIITKTGNADGESKTMTTQKNSSKKLSDDLLKIKIRIDMQEHYKF